MSTKQQTQSSNQIQYSPTGTTAYNSLIPQSTSTLSDIQQNPLQSMFFQNLFGQAAKSIGTAGQAANKNIFGNLAASGMAGRSLPGYAASMLRANSRATSGQKAGAMTNLLNQAQALRYSAAGTGAAFQPLMTGSSGNQTTTTSGLGTWLPQLAGAAIGGVTSGLTGGLSSLSKVAGAAASAGGGSPFIASPTGNMMNMMPSTFNASNPFFPASNPFSAYNMGGH